MERLLWPSQTWTAHRGADADRRRLRSNATAQEKTVTHVPRLFCYPCPRLLTSRSCMSVLMPPLFIRSIRDLTLFRMSSYVSTWWSGSADSILRLVYGFTVPRR